MTRSTQEKFRATLEAMAAHFGLELVDNRQWANTGTYRIEREDSFTPIVSMSYSFQDDYASFDNLFPADLGDREKMLRDTAGGPITPHGTHFPYVKPDELESRVLRRIRERLAAVPA